MRKNKSGWFLTFFGVIILFIIFLRVVLYIPVPVAHCPSNTKYIKGYCVFVEINNKYAILQKKYIGNSYLFGNIVATEPVYLFDKEKKEIIKKGKIGWWINADDLEVSSKTLYFKNNYGGFIFSTYNTPSLKEPWVIRNDN